MRYSEFDVRFLFIFISISYNNNYGAIIILRIFALYTEVEVEKKERFVLSLSESHVDTIN